MASGDQVVDSTSGKYMTQVTVTKPSTLIPANIKSGVDIGGVIGTMKTLDLPFVNLTTQTVNDGVITFTSTTRYNTFIAKHKDISSIILTAILGGSSNTDTCSLTYESGYDTLSTSSFVVSYDNTSSTYTYTWNLATSSSAAWYEGTISIYAC